MTHSTSLTLHPCAKVNLGLNVVRRRADGYHDIETVFYPIPLHDTLVVRLGTRHNDTEPACILTLKGTPIEGNIPDNLVCRAYQLMAQHYPLPPMDVVLDKHIPSQAGLGGGSSDAAAMLNAINTLAHLHLDTPTLQHYAAQLGADCPFFITCHPAYATGIGEILTPIKLDLSGWNMLLVRPDDPVSTREAYGNITPTHPEHHCNEIVTLPVEQWQEHLHNDFEKTVLPTHPAIAEAMQQLTDMKPAYVQMSGSGSTVFALARQPFNIPQDTLRHWWHQEVIL